ncbi:PepSY domain-containing protein [Aquicella lusitana]|uniref:PepSY domain-containing protein n=1 Tax=Aquicella lusitana TaxID=254246 RepID=UPI0011C05C12|nr:PepSY domain-containing protein [Aquicella lusitana]
MSTSVTLADNLPATAVPLSAVITNLQTKGYNNIKEVKFEHGFYEAEAMNAQENEVKLEIDPKTNAITKTKIGYKMKSMANPKISMLDAIKKVGAAGYHDIYKIEFKKDKYEVKALDKNNKEVELRVNANTGEVSKEWF